MDLVAALGGRMSISEYLILDNAFLEPEVMVIYGQSGADLFWQQYRFRKSDL